MELYKDETILIGSCEITNGVIIRDNIFLKIEYLINNYFLKIATDESGWIILYQDPTDFRYWELSYPESELQGGGAPLLQIISFKEASSKYKI